MTFGSKPPSKASNKSARPSSKARGGSSKAVSKSKTSAGSVPVASPKPQFRIVMAGAGIAAMSLALALKQALKDAVEIRLFDPALATLKETHRAYAIAAEPRLLLERLGVWPEVASAAQPILRMDITDSRLRDAIRPVFLTFDKPDDGSPFAHMIEEEPLAAALGRACVTGGIQLSTAAVHTVTSDSAHAWVTLDSGDQVKAHLVVAADGGRSRLREEAGLGWIGWSYDQAGIVACIGHERDHEGVAVEHFLPSGPFAILPLSPGGRLRHRSSIVWTERQKSVPRLLGLDETGFLEEVRQRFGFGFGALSLEAAPRAYPLSFGVARRFTGERLALLGDAAHVIHPIAGQGLNLGLRDAEALAGTITGSVRLGLDPGQGVQLAAYDRARRSDTLAMGAMTDGLNRLFSNDALPFRLTRDFGLSVVERLPGLKRFFMREAEGTS